MTEASRTENMTGDPGARKRRVSFAHVAAEVFFWIFRIALFFTLFVLTTYLDWLPALLGCLVALSGALFGELAVRHLACSVMERLGGLGEGDCRAVETWRKYMRQDPVFLG